MTYSYDKLMKFKRDNQFVCKNLRDIVLAIECASLLGMTSVKVAFRPSGTLLVKVSWTKRDNLLAKLHSMGFHASSPGAAVYGIHNVKISWATERSPSTINESKFLFGAKSPAERKRESSLEEAMTKKHGNHYRSGAGSDYPKETLFGRVTDFLYAQFTSGKISEDRLEHDIDKAESMSHSQLLAKCRRLGL